MTCFSIDRKTEMGAIVQTPLWQKSKSRNLAAAPALSKLYGPALDLMNLILSHNFPSD